MVEVKKPSPNRRKIHTRSAGEKPTDRLGFPDLAKQPGVTIKNKTRVLAKTERFFYVGVLRGQGEPPLQTKARYQSIGGSWTFNIYEGMTPYLREFRRNWIVRRAVKIRAFWTTKEGFETKLSLPNSAGMTEAQVQDALKSYEPLRDYIDGINKDVGLQNALKIAQTKNDIWGRNGFEIVRSGIERTPVRLLPLNSDDLVPLLDSNWNHVGFSYEGEGDVRNPFYQPDEVLFFVSDDLEGNLTGLSEIEPILKETELDDKIYGQDLTEALTMLWAGYAIFRIDRSKMGPGVTDEDVANAINDFLEHVKPGKSIATENVWDATVVDIKPDLDQIVNVSESNQRRVVGNFGVPRFMMNIEYGGWNRATAFTELEVFVDGPITDNQATLKQQVDKQWYEPLTRIFLGRSNAALLRRPHYRGQKAPQLPVIAELHWREIRTADWFQLLTAGAAAFQAGAIDKAKFYDIMWNGSSADFDPSKLPPEPTLPILPTTPKPAPTTTPPPNPGLQTVEQMRQEPYVPALPKPTQSEQAVFKCDCCGVKLRNPARKMQAGNKTVMVGPECIKHPDQFPCGRYMRACASA